VVQVVVEVVDLLILIGMEEPVIHLLFLLQMVDLKVDLVEWVILVFQDLVEEDKLPVVVVEQLLTVKMVRVLRQVMVVQVEQFQLQELLLHTLVVVAEAVVAVVQVILDKAEPVVVE
tara:strand:+ start:364 stop:714 length:351 start_codon:yes stop_codon:yes gene_type:complete